MEKLKELWDKIVKAFKALSKGVRVALIVAVVTTIIAFISMMFYMSANKYQVLFSNLEDVDAQTVKASLEEKQIDMKIEGNTILVPKDMVDSLRLELAPSLTSGSSGYELMDSSSSFGMTDEEFKLKKMRMLTGELERTIKSFSQIESARVHITESKDSVFVEDKTPGKAAVYIKLSSGAKLSNEQVSSIVSLVSGSLSNTPKENIEVIDDKMNLLTSDLNSSDDTFVGAEEIEKQYLLESKFESELEDTINKLLEPVLGRNKTSVSVKATIDFDSKKSTETVIDPNKVIISQQTIENNSSTGSTNESNSAVDNNMGNTVEEEGGTTTSSSIEQSTNYEVGKKETQTISAPGEIKRLTATVFVDGNLNENLQSAIESAIGTAIGLKAERGDEITVVGMAFDSTYKEELEAEKENIQNMFDSKINWVLPVIIAGGVLLLIIIIFLLLRKRKKKHKGVDDNKNKSLLDVVIDEKISPVVENQIDFESNDERIVLEKEIKNYAQDKPEQVVDIIKSWLNEDER